MKASLLKALSATAIAALVFSGCSPSDDASDIRTNESRVTEESTIFPTEDLVQSGDSDENIVAGDVGELDMSKNRADVESNYTPPVEEPTEEASEEATLEEDVSSPSPSQNNSNSGDSTNNSSSNSGSSTGNSGGSSNSGNSSNSGGSSTTPAPSTSRGRNGVYNLTSARNYLASYCPAVNIESVQGSTSYYDPNRNMIMLATNVIGGENRVYFVVMHELMHHYQNMTYDNSQWNAKLSSGVLEQEADRMSFQVDGGLVGQGHYTNTRASGTQLSHINQLISTGRSTGC